MRFQLQNGILTYLKAFSPVSSVIIDFCSISFYFVFWIYHLSFQPSHFRILALYILPYTWSYFFHFIFQATDRGLTFIEYIFG